MPAIFVHGVPETGAIWTKLLALIQRPDAFAVDLPGFGTDLTPDFQPTMDSYATWLASIVSNYDEVDLVGHDWGGLLVLRVLSSGPSNIRTWAVDNGDLGPAFTWHDGARAWQAPGSGEDLAAWLGQATDAERTQLLEGLGVPNADAGMMAATINPTMTSSMLALYRSAIEIGTSWGPALDQIDCPGLCIHAGRDPYRSAEAAEQLASRVSAELLTLPEAGHFWMLEDHRSVAGRLEAFWSRHS